ncbi:MAG: GC-type dockerin domain-anchored protein [Phycisphaerales bacterium JB039]
MQYTTARLVAGFVVATAGAATAQPLIGGNLLPTPSLVSVDLADASTMQLVALGDNPQGLAYDEASGELYSISAGSDSVSRIDMTTGVMTLIAPFPYENANALAYHSGRKLLYAADINSNTLFTIDPVTRDVSEIGVISGAQDIEGLAYDAGRDILYGAADRADEIVIIDPDTAAATSIGLRRPAVNWRGLTYSPSLGALFASVSVSGSPYRIDDPAGSPSLTEIGRIAPAGAVQGLAWVEEESCCADLDGDGVLTFFDFLEFQNLFAMGDLRADFTGDGALDFFDFLAFQNEFAAGCP